MSTRGNSFNTDPVEAARQRMQAALAASNSGFGDPRQTQIAYNNAQDAYNRAVMAADAQRAASSVDPLADQKAKAAANFQSALDMTKGRGDAVMSDPYTQAALNRFQSVLGGQDVPYTDQVQSQLLARQADAGAAAGSAQAAMLRDSMAALGGSMADPQAQAAMRQIQAQLQQQNNANLGDMQSKATLANFGARNDAASSLAATRASQLGMANGQYNQASQLYANQSFAGQHQNAAQDNYPTQVSVGGGGQVWGGGGTTTPFTGSPIGYTTTTSGTALTGNYNQPPNQVATRPVTLSTGNWGAGPAGYSNSIAPSYRLQGPAAPNKVY